MLLHRSLCGRGWTRTTDIGRLVTAIFYQLNYTTYR